MTEKKFRVATLVVGNEILMGKTRDTNTQFLIDILLESGLRLSKWVTVPDRINDISKEVGRLFQDGFDLIVISGGMGPTHDDITVASVAKGLGIALRKDRNTMDRMVSKWKVFFPGREMPPESRRPLKKMATIPEGSVPLHNSNGIAEGIHMEMGGKTVVIVPGVPGEYRAVIGGEEFLSLLPESNPDDQRIGEMIFRGAESQISEFLERYQNDNPSLDIGSYPQDARHVIIRITGKKELIDEARHILDRKIAELERYNEMEGI